MHCPNALALVRHGESAGNVARDAAERDEAGRIEIADRDMDVPLSDRGARQAHALGQWLAAGDIETPDVAPVKPQIKTDKPADHNRIVAPSLDEAGQQPLA